MPCIIGDVHGEYDLLLELIEKLPNRDLIFVGDLIDRGQKSRQVVELVIKEKYKCVLGNHEQMMIYSLSHPDILFYSEMWSKNGGKRTLHSYYNEEGVLDFALLTTHKDWMEQLPPVYYVNANIIVSHSKCLHILTKENLSRLDSVKIKEEICWNRDDGIEVTDKLNIHGHSIINNVFLDKSSINIDTGAHKRGILTAIDTDTFKVYSATKLI